jgi:hypothetical protein
LTGIASPRVRSRASLDVGRDLDRHAVGIEEPEPIAATRAGEIGRFGDDLAAGRLHLRKELVNVGPRRGRPGDHIDSFLLGLPQAHDVMFGTSGGRKIDETVVGRHFVEPPDVGIEAPLRFKI